MQSKGAEDFELQVVGLWPPFGVGVVDVGLEGVGVVVAPSGSQSGGPETGEGVVGLEDLLDGEDRRLGGDLLCVLHCPAVGCV